MGLFNKIKNMFQGISKEEKNSLEEIDKEFEEEEEVDEEETEEEEEVDEEESEEEEEVDEEESEEEEEVDEEESEEEKEVDEEESEEEEEVDEEESEEEEEVDEEESEEEEEVDEEKTEEEEEVDEEESEEEEEVDDKESEKLKSKQSHNEKKKINIFNIGKKKTEKKDKDELNGTLSEKTKKEVKIYEKGLTKSRQGFVSKLINLTNKYSKITDEYFDELEEILIMADIGVNTVMNFIDRLRDRVKKENITDTEYLKEIIVDELFIIYVNDEVLSSKINYSKDGPTIILFVGVNGVGKTTTIGKIAYKLKNEGKKVLLVGADTFRAGAFLQLKEWSEKVDVGFYGKEEGSDPASVVYDGLKLAQDEKYDVVLIDTAGRLQNKVNLMKELEKINKVIENFVSNGANETLLVVDATTGQNGISQAKSFKEITNITGIVLTKLDGTAKGGIVLAIKEEVGLPVKYIGLGESKDDLQAFDIEKYIYGLFKDMM